MNKFATNGATYPAIESISQWIPLHDNFKNIYILLTFDPVKSKIYFYNLYVGLQLAFIYKVSSLFSFNQIVLIFENYQKFGLR